jgi:translation initiation factor 2B subunit (eIF-2B alpha/beta/delta family)
MQTSLKEDGHAFILDAGERKYHLNSKYKFEMERWVQAIYISMQSARESHASLGNACKNISKTILAYDADANKLKTSTEEYLNKKLTLEIEEWEDIEELLN